MRTLQQNFGKKLRKIRRMQDLTQEELAERAEVSVDFISLVERGKNQPSFKVIEKLSAALNTPVADFFDFQDH